MPSRLRFAVRAAILALLFAPLLAVRTPAQAPAAAPPKGRILLVLPFDNHTGLAKLEWIREAAADLLSDRLRAAGFAPLSRPDRDYAFDHLGLPTSFQPSRASSLKLAETLDAETIVVGEYQTEGTQIVVVARLLDVPGRKMSPPVSVRGEMKEMIGVVGSLAWQLTRQMDPGFPVAEQTFVAAGSGMRMDAYEQYIRGITEPDQAERTHHLRQSATLSPGFAPAWMALGREQFRSQQYEEAAQSFSHVTGKEAEALEAGFDRGLALIFSGDYVRAAEAFGAVARVLPLAEVLNNQGVALARRGKDGSESFRQAVAADPNDADYHFNLAISLKRKGDNGEALKELQACRKLRPADSEAEAVEASWTGRKLAPPPNAGDSDAAAGPEAKPDPLERIKRSFDAQAFRQAAAMMDQMDAAKLAALSPRERARTLAAQAQEDLDSGMLLEADRLGQAALAADGSVAAGHLCLAQVRERSNDAEAARREAHAAIDLDPSAAAFLVLARLDLAANRLDSAASEIEAALKLDAGNQTALQLKARIDVALKEKK